MNTTKEFHWKSISKNQIKDENSQKTNILTKNTLKVKTVFRNLLDRITGKEKQKFIDKIDQIKNQLVKTQDQMLANEQDIKKIKLSLQEEKHNTKVLKINMKHKEAEIEQLKLQLEQYKLELEEKSSIIESLKLEKSFVLEEAVSDTTESKIVNIKNNPTSIQDELEKTKKRWKVKETEAREYKKKLQEIIQMVTNISKEDIHRGVILIQQNTLNEKGEKVVRKFFKYNNTIIEYNENDIFSLESEEIVENIETQKVQSKIIPFHTYNQNSEKEEEILELAE